MSQAKVDRYKKEKKNRAKVQKIKKIKKGIAIVICSMVVGLAIGFPLGKLMYKYTDAQRKANAVIEADMYDAWASQYWQRNYAGIIQQEEAVEASDTDAATNTDAISSDE